MISNYHTKCILCSNLNIPILKGYEKHNLVKCTNCGLVFMKQIPTSDDLNLYYSKYSYEFEQHLSPITIIRYNSLLDEFEKYRKLNKILDVGCGQGYFLQEAKKRGWEVYGTEFSQTAFNICKSNGVQMKLGELNIADFEANSFDIITSFEVFEHINNPLEEIQKKFYLLKKGGLFYCTTPNFNSLLRYYVRDKYKIICYPEHLAYYTKKTLNKLIEGNGFKRVKFLNTGIDFSTFKSEKNQVKAAVPQHIITENIRTNVEKNQLLLFAKKIINKILSLTNLGLSLKGYYIKE